MGNDPFLIEKLIKHVEKNPILYDTNIHEYKNTYQKKLVWQDIAKEIGGKNGEAMCWKWKNLRDSYAKHKRNVTAPGDEVGQKFVNWRWAPFMTFLDPFLRKPREFEAVDTEDQEETITVDTSNIFQNVSIETLNRESPEQDSSSSGYYTIPRTFESNNRKRKFVETEEVPVGQYHQEITTSSERLDKVDYLFLNYAETFKKLTPRRQALLKLKMAKIFAEAELQELAKDPIKLEVQVDSE